MLTRPISHNKCLRVASASQRSEEDPKIIQFTHCENFQCVKWCTEFFVGAHDVIHGHEENSPLPAPSLTCPIPLHLHLVFLNSTFRRIVKISELFKLDVCAPMAIISRFRPTAESRVSG